MPSLTDLRAQRWDTKLIDFHRRRITNAADAVDEQDYVTLAQARTIIGGTTNVTNVFAGGGSPVVSGNGLQFASYVVPIVANVAIVDLAHGGGQLVSPVANFTIANPLNSYAGMWILTIDQDVTGGRMVTWDSLYKGVTVNDIDPTPNTKSIYQFFGSGGFWWPVCTRLGIPL